MGRRFAALPVAVLAASVALGIPDAKAGFLDHLFGGGVKQRKERFPPPPPVRKAKPPARSSAPLVKISAPSYYTYKADALTRVDFAPLSAIGQSASLDAMETVSPFRQAVGGLNDYELFAEAAVAKATVDHYIAKPDFIWIGDGKIGERAQAALAVLKDAASYELDADDYAVAAPAASAGVEELIRFEMALTARVLRYMSDAHGGRVDPNRISGYYDFAPRPLDAKAALDALASGGDVRATIEAAHPQNDAYRALRAELASLDPTEADDTIEINAKLLLRPGGSDPEFAKVLRLIARDLDDEMGGEYGPLLARSAGSETYTDELVPVIKAAQQKAGARPDGIIGPRTVAAFSGSEDSTADKIEKVKIALEQLRWLPSDLGLPRVFINQPAYTASFIDDSGEKLKMRVVVGKTTNQTSFFYDEIEQVDYNPYWGVPQSIIVNEMLPRLRRDPGYLDRAGYEVTDARGRRISSSAVNWGAYGSKVPFNVRQTPSEANALGELKILFPNEHAIYMHDTPQKKLFEREARAFSHGCVRLADPRAMAAAVLGTDVGHVAEKLKQGHSSEKVANKIPVYVAYFTAWPDANGTVEYFDDVYGRDDRLGSALESTDAVRAPSS